MAVFCFCCRIGECQACQCPVPETESLVCVILISFLAWDEEQCIAVEPLSVCISQLRRFWYPCSAPCCFPFSVLSLDSLGQQQGEDEPMPSAQLTSRDFGAAELLFLPPPRCVHTGAFLPSLFPFLELWLLSSLTLCSFNLFQLHRFSARLAGGIHGGDPASSRADTEWGRWFLQSLCSCGGEGSRTCSPHFTVSCPLAPLWLVTSPGLAAVPEFVLALTRVQPGAGEILWAHTTGNSSCVLVFLLEKKQSLFHRPQRSCHCSACGCWLVSLCSPPQWHSLAVGAALGLLSGVHIPSKPPGKAQEPLVTPSLQSAHVDWQDLYQALLLVQGKALTCC